MMKIEKIRNVLAEMSIEEFESVLYDCGIESIRPSVESGYVRCLRKRLPERDYIKNISQYNIKKEYFEKDLQEPEVA